MVSEEMKKKEIDEKKKEKATEAGKPEEKNCWTFRRIRSR